MIEILNNSLKREREGGKIYMLLIYSSWLQNGLMGLLNLEKINHQILRGPWKFPKDLKFLGEMFGKEKLIILESFKIHTKNVSVEY